MLNHPDVQRNWTQWSEDQTLHVSVSYSNPFRWQTRRRLANDYIRHMRNSPNISLWVVEMAYGDRPHEVTSPDHPQDIQLRTNHELFHKENGWNIGVSHFPQGWKYGCCSDADFHFTRHDWALETIHQLQHYEFVQPFSSYVDVSGNIYGQKDVPMRYNSAFFFNYIQNGYKVSPQYHNGVVTTTKDGKVTFTKAGADAYASALKAEPSEGGVFMRGVGATGGAIAFRRSAFEAVGGMLDRCILGHADWYMAFQLVGVEPPDIHSQRYHPDYKRYVRSWGERAKELKRNVGYTDGHAIHYWHGSKTRRAYSSRDVILARNQYSPYDDVHADYQGVWRLNPNKPELRDDIRRYFISRFEDDPNMYQPEKLLI